MNSTKRDTTEIDSTDPRIGDLIGTALRGGGAVQLAILGFPCDIGVYRNGGRPGASAGPDALRNILFRMTPDALNPDPFNEILRHTLDLGNLEIKDLEPAQIDLGKTIEPYLLKDIPVLVFGGGHETAYGHFLGYVGANKKICILNWDAHADVRTLQNGKGHSGSPFRQALDHNSNTCAGYTVAGLQPHSIAVSHLEWMQTRGCNYFFADQVNSDFISGQYTSMTKEHFVTFDLDAVDQSEAPGVSAPAISGVKARLWLQAAYEAGKSPMVSSMDIVELNPSYDVDNKTAGLAAKTAWMFLKGLAERKA